jgi:hypothetical protein
MLNPQFSSEARESLSLARCWNLINTSQSWPQPRMRIENWELEMAPFTESVDYPVENMARNGPNLAQIKAYEHVAPFSVHRPKLLKTPGKF